MSTPPTGAAASTSANTSSPRVYNAIYSSVQVYECMVRGIAVMRRRLDSYVNATQILKVAGIDKGRRTKILEKEILPGRHEIVQGGYGKYQGTWIPLERGREVATQFGVLPILAPLFDYVPQPPNLGSLPSIRPSHALFYPAGGPFPPYSLPSSQPIQLPYPPGTALNMLQHGRSTGLFTPTATFGTLPPGFQFTGIYSMPQPLSQQSSEGSVAPPVGNPPLRASITELPASGSTPTPDIRPSPAPSISSAGPLKPTEPQVGHKRPRPLDDPTAPSTSGSGAQSSHRVLASQNTNLVEGGSIPNTIAPDDARSNKRPRLSPADHAESAPFTTESTQVDPDALAQSQTTIVDGSSNLFGDPSIAAGAQASVPPNGIHPPPLAAPVTRNLADLPETHSRLASKAPQPRSGDTDSQSPMKSAQCRAILLAIFSDEGPASVLQQLQAASSPDGPVDVDMVIDDQGHTALHWAISLSRLQYAESLIAHGADVHRGNFAGETPLIRAVLSTQPHETNTFPDILTMLVASLRTVDKKSQSVLHHIAHVAGVKGRAAAARYYMETVLERVVRQRDELGGTVELVDLQDVHGDTALNISARVGNRALVRMLIDIGANRILGNKLGLRPGDFGVEGENLKAPFAEDYLAALRKGLSPPVQKSQDVIADLTSMIENLSSEFSSEIKTKQDALDVTQAHLRAATRELAEQRRQIQQWQGSISQLDQIRQRIRNVERVLKEEDAFDWTGRTNVDGKPADSSVVGKMFEYRGPGSTLVAPGGKVGAPVEMSLDYDPDPSFPTFGTSGAPSGSAMSVADKVATLIRLRRMRMWHQRMDDLIQQRISGSKGASAEKEIQCRKVVSLCTGVPVDQIDAMLDNLVIAMESDGQVVDLGRVAGFMQKVNNS